MAIIDFKDMKLSCADCGEEFTFTAGEQKYFLEKAYDIPRRCVKCRAIRKKDKKKKRVELLKIINQSKGE
jgi:hypothetical protein